MSARDDTPEEETPGRVGGVEGRREPEREPLGYYYDDGTNYETYDPEAEDAPEGPDGREGPAPEGAPPSPGSEKC